MNFKNTILALAALVIGVGAGFWAGTGRGAKSDDALPKNVSGEKRIADAGEPAAVKRLRAKVAELERQLAQKTKVAEPGPDTPEGVAKALHDSHREMMARMEKENPARYAQITNRIASWRRRRADNARERIDFLSSIDISGMSEEARKVHEEFQLAISRREEIEASFLNGNLDDGRRRELFNELRKNGAKVRELAAKERDNLLTETARNLGFDGEDASEIVATVKEVVEATDGGWGFGHGRGGGRGARR